MRHLSKEAFTLIELLVVVAIIAILSSLVLVCISSVRELGRRTKCMSNIRNMGMGVMSLATDNRGVLPSTTMDKAFPRANPGWMWLDAGPVGFEDNLTVAKLAQYLPNGERIYGEMQTQLAGAAVNSVWKSVAIRTEWECPTYRGERWGNIYAANVDASGKPCIQLSMGYAYYARIAELGQRVNKQQSRFPELLTGRRLDAERVLLSDTLFMWLPGAGGGGSNHSQRHGFTGTGAGGNYSDMAGVNQFFGDGSVRWKARDQFNIPAMCAGALSVPSVHPEGHGESFDYF